MTPASAPQTKRQRSRWRLANRIVRRVYSHPANSDQGKRAVVRAVLWQARKRLGLGEMRISAYGLRLSFPRASGSLSNLVYFGECYEWAEINFIRKYLRRGDVVVDVGANIGLFAYASLECIGLDGRVHAVEPIPWAARTIEENVRANDIGQAIEVHQVASGASEGMVEFTADLDVSNHQVWSDRNSPSRESMSVRMRPLDDILAGGESLALLKLDVEGGEMQALKGFTHHLEESNPPVCIIEAHDHSLRAMGASREQVMSLLDGYGYSPWLYDVKKNALIQPPDTWNKDIIAVHVDSLENVEQRLHEGRSDGASIT